MASEKSDPPTPPADLLAVVREFVVQMKKQYTIDNFPKGVHFAFQIAFDAIIEQCDALRPDGRHDRHGELCAGREGQRAPDQCLAGRIVGARWVGGCELDLGR